LLHRFSGRRGKFIPIHTPSIPGNLFESELFGHKKGAFTDARSDKKGMVAEGEGGTLFFDEISEVPIAIQAKLLRFIETRKYIVLGETCERTADVRIVAATNRDMHQAIEDKEFREDLYYRLQVLEIEIPPLRRRREDVKTLVLENMELLRDKGVGKGFWEAVSDYLWPGNVRELLTVLRRAGIMLDGPVTGDDIRELIRRGRYKAPVLQIGDTADNTGRMWEELRSGKSFWEAVKAPFLQREVNRAEVKALVVRGLDLAGGKYVDLLRLFHVEKKDYHKFMAFLSDYKLK
ncbi:MAG: sigma-54-dependent Fis family transcriptional regulator, partial [bacterium]|nr:sigma-54-dependent Fis family transcriptional regulator [bacterium]